MTDEMLVLPGDRCRRAREEQGLSQQEAANRLHLSASYLQALEADDYERLPEATFVKGYLRNYAKLLGLPADEVANTFQQMVNEDRYDKALAVPVVSKPSMDWRKPAVIILLLLLLIALLWWLLPLSGSDDAVTNSETPVSEVAPASEAAMPPAEAMPDSAAVSQAMQPEPELEQTELPAGPVADEPDTGAQAGTASAAAEQPLDDGIDRLTMVFSEACWLSLTDNTGRRVFEGEQPAGSLNVEGQAPFRLVAGNPTGITEVTLNGEAVILPTIAGGSVLRTQLR